MSDFVQLVRSWSTSSLLDLCASESVVNVVWARKRAGPPTFPEHFLAEVALAAVVCGNNHRPAAVRDDLGPLRNAFMDLGDVQLNKSNIGAHLVRLANAQFPAQRELFAERARVFAVLIDGASASYGRQTTITPQFWEGVFGCTLPQLAFIAHLLFTSALANGGRFNAAWIDQSNFESIRRIVPRDTIVEVVERHFVADRGRIRAEHCGGPTAELRHDCERFNPLVARPFVSADGRVPICPSIPLLERRASAEGLYYDAARRGGDPFTIALGYAFESYVGLQLSDSQPIRLEPEIRVPEERRRSVDYIAVFADMVVLIEAKTSRLTIGARQGGAAFVDDCNRTIGEACAQIEDVAALIREGHSLFEWVPKDRRIVGLVVTLEPYYMVDLDLAYTMPKGRVPYLVASAAELERMIAIEGEALSTFLLRTLDAPGKNAGSIGAALLTANVGRNRLLEQALAKHSLF